MDSLAEDSGAAEHYKARAAWKEVGLDDFLGTKITSAIFREDSISIVWPPTYGEIAQTNLTKTSDSRYSGRSIWAPGKSKERIADVDAVLYSNKLGHILVGEEKYHTGEVVSFVVQLIGPPGK